MVSIPKNCKCPKLFEELARQNLSQKDFAEKIGASTGNVSDWANGKSSPSRRRWSVISEVLGKPANELMGTKKEPAGDGGLDEQMKNIVSLLSAATKEERDAVETLLESKKKSLNDV